MKDADLKPVAQASEQPPRSSEKISVKNFPAERGGKMAHEIMHDKMASKLCK